MQPLFVQTLLEAADARLRAGEAAAALSAYDRALAHDGFGRTSEAAIAHSNRGAALAHLGRSGEAISAYGAALALAPQLVGAYANRGEALAQMRRFGEAAADFARAYELAPGEPQFLLRRGDCVLQQGRPDEAIDCYDRVLELSPDHRLARRHRGHALMQLQRFEEARAMFAPALASAPQDYQAEANMGWLEFESHRLAPALAHYTRAVALAGRDYSPLYHRGLVFMELARLEEAIADFSQALALRPDHKASRVNRGYCRLALGDLAGGFGDYDARNAQELTGLDPDRFLTPERARDLRGKTVLVVAEIGLGDTLQFCRYLAPLAARGAKVKFEIQPRLKALLAPLAGDFEAVERTSPRAAHDFWLRIVSLPYAFEEKPPHFYAPQRYLKAAPGRVAKWRRRLGDGGFKIGVCWRGEGRGQSYPRNFPAAALAPLAQLPGVRLINLSREMEEGGGAPVEWLGADYDAGPDAFLDAAAVIAHCDAVVSCDTSLAHLAGALGARTFVALKFSPEWRWFQGREPTPWYATMRLFKQPSPGDWAGALAAIAAAVKAQL